MRTSFILLDWPLVFSGSDMRFISKLFTSFDHWRLSHTHYLEKVESNIVMFTLNTRAKFKRGERNIHTSQQQQQTTTTTTNNNNNNNFYKQKAITSKVDLLARVEKSLDLTTWIENFLLFWSFELFLFLSRCRFQRIINFNGEKNDLTLIFLCRFNV